MSGFVRKMSTVTAAKRLIPLLDRVLVEKIVPPTRSAGGILLPETTAKVSLRVLNFCYILSFRFLFVSPASVIEVCELLLILATNFTNCSLPWILGLCKNEKMTTLILPLLLRSPNLSPIFFMLQHLHLFTSSLS